MIGLQSHSSSLSLEISFLGSEEHRDSKTNSNIVFWSKKDTEMREWQLNLVYKQNHQI